MFISKVSFTPMVYSHSESNQRSKRCSTEIASKVAAPQFAYRDYNINFGARLFRSPANFFAQDFNRNNMPDTMKNYLYADYEDRQNMPPNQMLRLVFDDLNEIQSLDFVPRVFSDEPLFANLSDRPKKNARTGLLSEIEAMRSETEDYPLFKDGNSNFGMYLLRKIYLEGKTRKEINKDFKNDLSPIYKDLITSDIDYDTIAAYGIKFPKAAFWKSFTATREDFPYEYKPRKVEGSRLGVTRERTLSDITSGNNSVDTRPQRFKTGKEFEKRSRRMGEAILSGHGDKKSTEKALRHKGVYDTEELSFVSKYLSQIMSVALEKTHASEEMRSYFENYDSMNKRQREKMESYWRSNPFMRDFQSLAISDTIKLFYDAYGADGNNDEFRDLINYANQIKPLREQKLAEHNARQAELEEIFAAYDEPEKSSSPVLADESEEFDYSKTYSDADVEALAEKEALKQGAEVFTYISPTGEKYCFIGKVDELFADKMKEEFRLLPDAIVKKFINFAQKHKDATYDYKKSVGIIAKVPDFVRERIMSIDECRAVSYKINEAFDKKYKANMIAAEQALAERMLARCGDNYAPIMKFNAMELSTYAMDKLNIDSWNDDERAKLEQDYHTYSAPVKDKVEAAKISQAFVDTICAQDPSSLYLVNFGETDDICALFAATLRKYPQAKPYFLKALRQDNFMERYGGTSRILIKSDVSDRVKIAKAKLMIDDMISDNSANIINILITDASLINKYVRDDNIRLSLLQRHYTNKLFR